MKQRSLPSIITGALLVVVLGLYMITYQVRFNEVAIVRTFGKITEPDPETGESPDVKMLPGLYWKWPWPIQGVRRYDNRLQITETTGEEIPTDDEKNVIVTTAVGWRIEDPYRFSILHHDMREAEEKLKTILRTHQKTVIGQHDLEDFVSAEEKKIQYDEIEDAVFQKVKAEASEKYGIKLEYIGIEKLALPKRITENVFSAMKEERNAEAARFTSEGESKANQIRTQAESIAGTILAFARRQAGEIVAEGKKRAAEYNETFGQDEDLAVFLLQMDYLSTILKSRTTVVLDGLQSPLNVLGEAMRRAAGAAEAPPAAEASAASPAVNVQVPETADAE